MKTLAGVMIAGLAMAVIPALAQAAPKVASPVAG
jgi:hypothetical protein